MNARDGNGARRALEEHDGACTIGGEYGAGGDACKRDIIAVTGGPVCAARMTALASSISARLRPMEPTAPAAPVTRIGLACGPLGVMRPHRRRDECPRWQRCASGTRGA